MSPLWRVVLAGSFVLLGCTAQSSPNGLRSDSDVDPSECPACPPPGELGNNAPDAGPKPITNTSACRPGDMSGWQAKWAWTPAPHHQGVCTDAQIAAVYEACLGPQKSASQCDGLRGQYSVLSACASCILPSTSQGGANATAPVVTASGDGLAPNTAGCIGSFPDLVDCGMAYKGAEECPKLACEANCKLTPAEYPRCVKDAQAGTCKTFGEDVAKCSARITGEALACLDGTDAQGRFKSIAKLFCGR
jgi:hypothetical protein